MRAVRDVGSTSRSPTTRRRSVAARRHAAEHGADTGEELARVHGLRQVVVRPELEADDAVRLVALRGEHEHRDGALLAEPAEHVETVETRHHHVEDDDVHAALRERGETAPAVGGVGEDDVMGREVRAQQVRELAVVVDEEGADRHRVPGNMALPGSPVEAPG
jgi:hypothetical protein